MSVREEQIKKVQIKKYKAEYYSALKEILLSTTWMKLEDTLCLSETRQREKNT